MAQGRVFQVGACLGRGGFGEVYRARMTAPTGFEVEVALKVLRRDLDPSSQAVQRLRDEGRLLARLSHPAVLRAFDLAVVEDRVALVTEYVEGQDLAEIVQEGPMTPRAALEVIGRVAGALDAAWSAPIGVGTLQLVHRDIKPSNIRISRHGDVKVLDFGIARTDSVEREARTGTDMMIGSPPYMAPERFLDGTVRLASDVYALGAALFEALTGRRLLADQSVTLLAGLAVHANRHDAFVEARLGLLAGLPPGVTALVRDCLAFDPVRRPTPAEVEARADALSDDAPGLPLARWARERRWPKPARFLGDLAGRTIEEGHETLPRERPLSDVTTAITSVPPARARGWWWLGGAAAGLGTAGLALAAVGVALGLAALGMTAGSGIDAPNSSPAPAIESAPGASAAPAETTPPAPAPSPSPSPSPEEPLAPAQPAAAEGRAAARPAPTPIPQSAPGPSTARSTAPPTAPSAAPSTAPLTTVKLEGAAELVLRSSNGSFPVPGAVPAGVYTVRARWRAEDAEWVDLVGKVSVPEGSSKMTLLCTSRFGRCNPG